MAELTQELDAEIVRWRQMTFADSTKASYESQRRAYLMFCQSIEVSPVPASISTVCRYAAFLGRTKAFATVQQYLNIIRILHLELGLCNPLANNWPLTSLLRGMKRVKGSSQSFKLPISPEDLQLIHGRLNLNRRDDTLFWATIVTCFFGLLRISNVAANSKDNRKLILRKDMSLTTQGITLHIRGSKTIQCLDRTHEVVLPFIPNHKLCPTAAILRLLGMSSGLSPDDPMFAYEGKSGKVRLSPTQVHYKLCSILKSLGYQHTDYGTHSLRRGGATWLILSGVPLPVVKALGDWKSDAIMKYIKPSNQDRFLVLKTVALNLHQ